MKLISIIGVAALVVVTAMWWGNKQAKQNVQSENENLKDSIEMQIDHYEDSLSVLDSAYTVESNKSDSLAKRAKKFENLWWLEKKAKEDITAKYDSLKQEVDSLPIDSLAQYIINHYAGDNYELLDVGFVKGDSSIYIAFQEITTRDIVDKHIDYREQKEVIANQENQIQILEKLNGIKDNEIVTLKDRNGNLELQVEKLNDVKNMYKDLASEYKDEAVRQKGLKTIGYVVAISEAIAILILL